MVYEEIKSILEISLRDKIKSVEIKILHNQLKTEFSDSSLLYIVYNEFGEYAYQLIFSNNKLDRIRFDSMDKNWEVDTNPNHFHPRFSKNGYNSPMTGKYENDLPILIKLINNGNLLDENYRF